MVIISVRDRYNLPVVSAFEVDTMTDDSVTVTLVNVNGSVSRLVTVQAGAYGEHNVLSVSDGVQTQLVNDRSFAVRLAPGTGAKLTVKMKRFANQPTLAFPWGSSA
jgi:hypothetical protein